LEKLKSEFKTDEIGHMTCLGRCHENSAFHYKGLNYSGDAVLNLKNLVSDGSSGLQDTYHVEALQHAILTRPFGGISNFYDSWKRVLTSDPGEVLEEIKTSNLRGRGGAGFPMGLKLEFCRKEESAVKFIICNADEGDPGAYSDRYLLEQQPHAVLFGMLVSGFVTGANHGIVYIRAEYPEAAGVIQKAIKDLNQQGLAGKNIQDSGFDFEFKIIQAQGSYICGEETALINSIEGQRPEIRVRPPYPAQKGLFNKPTVVNNVETLAALHFIISEGGAAWKAIGTERSSGTKLVCLDSFFNRPGVYEVDMGTPMHTIVKKLGRGFKSSVKAVQIGGPLGGVVPVDKLDELTLDFESFSAGGFLLGHASVVSIPEDYPMIQYIQHLFDFAAYESCGKCFPCRLGTKRGHEMATKAIEGSYTIDRELFNDLLTTLKEGSLCAHGGGIPLPVKNILEYFDSELKAFFN
jgi:NADH-quinone oxidoreductase subunit F